MQFKFFNKETNEELFIGEISDFESNIEHEQPITPINVSENLNKTYSLDIGNLHIDEALFNQLTIPEKDKEFSLKINATREIDVQKKKHKKKRINKKWLKKYGYKFITIPINIEISRCKFTEEGIETSALQNY